MLLENARTEFASLKGSHQTDKKSAVETRYGSQKIWSQFGKR
jgi:hypothetical protein